MPADFAVPNPQEAFGGESGEQTFLGMAGPRAAVYPPPETLNPEPETLNPVP